MYTHKKFLKIIVRKHDVRIIFFFHLIKKKNFEVIMLKNLYIILNVITAIEIVTIKWPTRPRMET